MADNNSGFVSSSAPNSTAMPVVKTIFDLSYEALGELKTWLEQNPPSIPVTQIVGYQTNTVKIYKKAPGSLTISNSAAETSIATETIPGGTMGTTGMVRLTIFGLWTNTTGVNQNLTLKIKFGGVTVHNSTDLSPNGNSRPVLLEVVFANQGATNSQKMVAFWNVGNNSAPTTGISSIGAGSDRVSLLRNNTDPAVDTTVSQTLDITVTLGTASSSLTFLRDYYMLEFL